MKVVFAVIMPHVNNLLSNLTDSLGSVAELRRKVVVAAVFRRAFMCNSIPLGGRGSLTGCPSLSLPMCLHSVLSDYFKQLLLLQRTAAACSSLGSVLFLQQKAAMHTISYSS